MFRVTSPDGRFVVGGALKAPPRATSPLLSRAPRRFDAARRRVAPHLRAAGSLLSGDVNTSRRIL